MSRRKGVNGYLIGIKDTKTNKAIAAGQLKQTITDKLPCFMGD
jgi:hypothetical protein